MTYEQFLEIFWQMVVQRIKGRHADLPDDIPVIHTPFGGDAHGREIAARIFRLPAVASIFDGAYELHDGGKYIFLTHEWDRGPRGREVLFAIRKEFFAKQEAYRK